MPKEFTKRQGKGITVFTLESDGGVTGVAAVGGAAVVKPLGAVVKRNPKEETIKVPVTQKPRQGPLRPQTGGGAHRDKKKEQKQGKEKHRKPYMEELKDRIEHLKSTLAENDLAQQMMAAAKSLGMNPRLRGTPDQERERTQQMMAKRDAERADQERQAGQADAAKLPELKAEYEAMKKEYESLGGSNWQYADREQNLSSAERKARSMEPELRNLWAKIKRAEQHSDQGVAEGWKEKLGAAALAGAMAAPASGITLNPNRIIDAHGRSAANPYGNVDSMGNPIKKPATKPEDDAWTKIEKRKAAEKKGVTEGSLGTYVLNVMDEATGEHWAIEIQATSPDMAKERAHQQGYKVLRIKEKVVDEGDVGKLAGLTALGIGAGLAGNYVDQQQPKVEIGGQQAYLIKNPGWGKVPDTAMILKGKDGKTYKVWSPSRNNKTLYATPADDVKEGNFNRTPSGDYVNMHTGVRSSSAPIQKKVRGYKWHVNFDYGPHMTDTVVVSAASESEAIAKAEKAAEKKGLNIMVNWAKPHYRTEQGVAEGFEQVYKVLAVDKSNALSKQVKLKVKASSLDEVFERLAINDWYPLEINGMEVINGKRLKQDVAEGGVVDAVKKGAKKAWDYATEPVDAPNMDTYKKNRAKNIADIRKKKQQGVAEESAPFGMNYAEQLAQKVFDHNPDLDTSGRADELLDVGYNIAKSELGSRAQGIFRSEDFPSDFVSAYGYLKNQGVAEGDNPEYDDEAGMADNNLETLKRAVDGLDNLINAGDNLPEWCQEKIAVAKSMLVTVWDYMQSEEQNMEEGLRDPKDNPCWKGYKPVGTKKKNGATVPNCVPKEGMEEDDSELNEGKGLAGDLARFLKANGFKGPYRLGKLPKWAAELPEFGKDDLIMVQGNDVEYDEFVVDIGYGILYWGGEGGMTKMTEKAIMNLVKQGVGESAPKGWEGTVKAMKKHKEIDNPWALAHYMKNKGYKSHKKEDTYMESLFNQLEERTKK